MKKKSRTKVIVVLLVIILILCGLIGGMVWYLNSHFFVDGKGYPNDAAVLDLQGRDLSIDDYEAIRQELPDCEIFWDVPFQNTAYANDTTSLSVQTLSDKDLETLAYFADLQQVDASGCREYEMLKKLKEQYPNVVLHYTVEIDGREYNQDASAVEVAELTDETISNLALLENLQKVDATACQDAARVAALCKAYPGVEVSYRLELLGQTFTETTESATFMDPDVTQLHDALAALPGLKKVHLTEPTADAESLRQLLADYPDVEITWKKTVLGKTFSSTDTEFDFSNMTMSGTNAVEEAMRYFPNAEKVIMSECGIDNETMAAFREKMRPEYKVVWTVYVTRIPVRTDEIFFHSSAHRRCLIDEQSYDLQYCEDMIVVDIGHSYVKYIEWVKGMPNLEYLIIGHNWIKDITPISTCKKLRYLELFMNDNLRDLSPLLGCTALEDLNAAQVPLADFTVLKDMTWLNNLWLPNNVISQSTKDLLTSSLPNTRVEFNGWHTGGDWRKLDNYFKMRDIMGQPYNIW